MNTKMYRRFAVLIMTGLGAAPLIASANTEESANYFGDAPESLDYPVVKKKMSAQERREFQREELYFISAEDPFPKTRIAPVDPLTKKKTDRVLTGPAFRTRGYGSGFDYYRYVTFYNVSLRKERIYELPVHREECHDQSEVFANYSYSYSYSASITASASIEGLGLSSSISASRSFSTARNLRATGETIAEHTPYFNKQDWEGRTFIQLLDSRTGKTEFYMKKRKASPWWVDLFFPTLSSTGYPMVFKVKNADWTFQVEREVTGSCIPGFEG